MQPTDKPAFAAIIAKTWRFYDKTPIAETVADWFDLLEGFALDAVATAFRRHLADPKAGQYLPKPADILRHLPGALCRDGRPDADEAWGMLLRLVNDESAVHPAECSHGRTAQGLHGPVAQAASTGHQPF